jgi:hypothetical protein
MPVAHEGNERADGVNWGVLTSGRMPDLGPRYTETPADPYAPDAPPIAEPWNAATALLFVVIVIVWGWRLRGRYRDYPFLCSCLPILLAGGIGGTLYHSLRTSFVFLLFDVVPIFLLALAGAVFLAVRLSRRRAWIYITGAVIVYFVFNGAFRLMPSQSVKWAVNISYASLALLILAPMALVLIRTRFRHGAWVVAGLTSFVIAWFFRLWDESAGPYLSMGSHWVWHTFGAISTALIIEYFYRVESEKSVDPRTAVSGNCSPGE